MAIEQQEIYYAYTGNGAVATFAYGCRIFKASDLVVKVNGVIQGYGVHYTLSGVDSVNGGEVTFLPGYFPSGLIELERVLAYARSTGYIENGDFRQETVDRDQDYQTALLQQMEGHRKYYMRQPVGSNVEMQLPTVTPGGLLAWNQAGDGIEYLLTGPPYVSTTVSASAYGTDISAAIAAVGSANVTLKIDSPITVNDNAAFHENTFVVVEKPGLLTIASGKTLTFSRQPVLPDGVCFSGGGLVHGLKKIYPEYFGGHGYANTELAAVGNADSTNAVNLAYNCLRASGGGVLRLSGVYRVTSANMSSQSYTNDAIVVQGVGARTSGFYGTDSGKIVVDCLGTDWLTFRDFGIYGQGTIGLLLARGTGITNKFCNYHKFYNLDINGSWSISAAVASGAEITTWYSPQFENKLFPHTCFITTDINTLGITSENGALLSGSGNGNTNTANKMYSPEFYAPYSGSIAVRLIGNAVYDFFSPNMINTAGNEPLITGAVGIQYESNPDSFTFFGPVNWYGGLFEGGGIMHYLKGVIGQANSFNHINIHGGDFNVFAIGKLDLVANNSASGTTNDLNYSNIRDISAPYFTLPTIAIDGIYKSNFDLFTSLSTGNTITIAVQQTQSKIDADIINSAPSQSGMHVETRASAIPTEGYHNRGDIVWNDSFDRVYGIIGWYCSVSGNPGYFWEITATNPAYSFANNAAAIAAGFPVGAVYRQGDFLAVVH